MKIALLGENNNLMTVFFWLLLLIFIFITTKHDVFQGTFYGREKKSQNEELRDEGLFLYLMEEFNEEE